MPIPMGGLVPVAEFGSVLEANLVAQRLRDAGIPATTSYDPALTSAVSYMATDRTVEVVVDPQQVERALVLLNSMDIDADDGLPDAFHAPEVEAWSESGHRPRPATPRPRSIVLIVVLLAICLPALAAVIIVATQ